MNLTQIRELLTRRYLGEDEKTKVATEKLTNAIPVSLEECITFNEEGEKIVILPGTFVHLRDDSLDSE